MLMTLSISILVIVIIIHCCCCDLPIRSIHDDKRRHRVCIVSMYVRIGREIIPRSKVSSADAVTQNMAPGACMYVYSGIDKFYTVHVYGDGKRNLIKGEYTKGWRS